MAQRNTKESYPALDLVRLCAALLVAIYHIGYTLPDHKITSLSFGWVGVEIFFVLSGFVIAFSARGKSLGSFVTRRAARLYPGALICSTIIAMLVPVTIGEYLRSVAILPIGPWVDTCFWTLPVEIAFYVVIAISIALRWYLRTVALALGSYSCVFWCAKAVNMLYPFANFSALETEWGFLLLAHYGVFFALGMTLYERMWPFAFAFFCMCFMAVAWRSHAVAVPGASFLIAPLIWALAATMIAAGIYWAQPIAGALVRVPTRTLGLMTYPLYLVHSAIFVAVATLVHGQTLISVIALLAALAVSFCVLPLESGVRRLFQLRRDRAPASLP